jgi:hypothetical protein
MAIYRLSASVVKRSAGRSATASAAYRAAEQIADARTGLAFDYRRKRGVVHTEIVTPPGTPEWMGNRAQLWNAVEQAEKRKDAQLAREIILALPFELTHPQRVELVREFAGTEFVGQGMIADIAIHAPDRKGDASRLGARIGPIRSIVISSAPAMRPASITAALKIAASIASRSRSKGLSQRRWNGQGGQAMPATIGAPPRPATRNVRRSRPSWRPSVLRSSIFKPNVIGARDPRSTNRFATA